MKKIIALLLFAASLFAAPAAILLNEPFDYTNGPLVAVSSANWQTFSGTANQIMVTNSRASMNLANGEDVQAFLSPPPSTDTVFAGFTLRFITMPPAAGGYFAMFKDTGASVGFRARVWALTNGAPGGKYRLGLSSTTTSLNATNLMDLSTNVDYRVVLRLSSVTGSATLWVNPAAETDPSVTTAETPASSTVTAFALRQGTDRGQLTIDDLVVGESFIEVISTNPPPLQLPEILTQPQSRSAVSGQTVVFSATVQGTEPLFYRWQFNGTNLPGATNISLLLSNVQSEQAGIYVLWVTNAAGATNSQPASLVVSPLPETFLSVLDYNTHGNFVADWTTNSPQVQAIGRQMMHLDPDIITFQEIPMTNSGWKQMANFVTAFRPGYYLATNSGTDGFIRSAVLSRFPIVRSQSWLDGADLNPFGYTNANFTRDLFEAEISVPGFSQSLHVFTTHLKSGTTASDDAARRAAEASAISNFFVTVFLPTNGTHPYLLTGDMNEDIDRPATGSQQPIQRMANAATGLQLTTPINPITGSELTFSIQATGGLTRRYDYIMPCGLLYSNFAGAQVFRTDLLTNPPAPLQTNDNIVASDHLPVLMYFANPYAMPFRLLSVAVTGGALTLQWESVSNRVYGVETSSNLTSWAALASNLVATGTNTSFTTNAGPSRQFFRVYREP